MAIHSNSEKKIPHDTFKISLGTTNKVNPLVVYVEGKTFISPLNEKDDYSRDISSIKYGLGQTIKNTINNSDLFDNKYILDFQIATKGITMNKKSFLTFQLLLKQKNQIRQLKDLKKLAAKPITDIMSSLKETIEKHSFSISKSKR